MAITLQGKAAIVTGAGRGIGKGIAAVFAKEGARVLVVNRSAEAGQAATEEIVLRRYVHVGVATDTERGLVVPVVRDADRKSLTELAVEVRELAERARDRKLGVEDMRGGTFTISNLGGLGTGFFTAILNPPEVGILAVGRAETEPVWIDGAFEPRLRMPLGLTVDHRLVDGADAARALAWIVEALEAPPELVV